MKKTIKIVSIILTLSPVWEAVAWAHPAALGALRPAAFEQRKEAFFDNGVGYEIAATAQEDWQWPDKIRALTVNIDMPAPQDRSQRPAIFRAHKRITAEVHPEDMERIIKIIMQNQDPIPDHRTDFLKLRHPIRIRWGRYALNIEYVYIKGLVFDANEDLVPHTGLGSSRMKFVKTPEGLIRVIPYHTSPQGGCLLSEAERDFLVSDEMFFSPYFQGNMILVRFPLGVGIFPGIYYTYPQNGSDRAGKKAAVGFVAYGCTDFQNPRVANFKPEFMNGFLKIYRRAGRDLRLMHDHGVTHAWLYNRNFSVHINPKKNPPFSIIYDLGSCGTIALDGLAQKQYLAEIVSDLYYAMTKAHEQFEALPEEFLDGYFHDSPNVRRQRNSLGLVVRLFLLGQKRPLWDIDDPFVEWLKKNVAKRAFDTAAGQGEIVFPQPASVLRDPRPADILRARALDERNGIPRLLTLHDLYEMQRRAGPGSREYKKLCLIEVKKRIIAISGLMEKLNLVDEFGKFLQERQPAGSSPMNVVTVGKMYTGAIDKLLSSYDAFGSVSEGSFFNAEQRIAWACYRYTALCQFFLTYLHDMGTRSELYQDKDAVIDLIRMYELTMQCEYMLEYSFSYAVAWLSSPGQITELVTSLGVMAPGSRDITRNVDLSNFFSRMMNFSRGDVRYWKSRKAALLKCGILPKSLEPELELPAEGAVYLNSASWEALVFLFHEPWKNAISNFLGKEPAKSGERPIFRTRVDVQADNAVLTFYNNMADVDKETLEKLLIPGFTTRKRAQEMRRQSPEPQSIEAMIGGYGFGLPKLSYAVSVLGGKLEIYSKDTMGKTWLLTQDSDKALVVREAGNPPIEGQMEKRSFLVKISIPGARLVKSSRHGLGAAGDLAGETERDI